MKFWLNNEVVTFNICRSMRQRGELQSVCAISYEVFKSAETLIEERLSVEALQAVIMNFYNECIKEYGSLVAALYRGDVRFKPKKYELDMKNREFPPSKPSIQEAPKLELKYLLPHLRYESLGNVDTLPVIIASDLNEQQVDSLVKVLRRFKRATGWTIQDIIGIPPGNFSHKIQLIPDHNPIIEHQRCLNSRVEGFVKKEIIKWLDTGVIYLIVGYTLLSVYLRKGE